MSNAPGRLANPTCPSCGGTRPMRSLVTCRGCWACIPTHIQQATYRAAKYDRTSIFVGDQAAQAIASAVKGRMVGRAA